MPDLESDLFLATRRSLITRLKNWDDQEGWREFFQTYWKLIFSVAIKSGLTEEEAQDVVQETVVTVVKTMDTYRYEPEKCRFKTWLMRITRLRIVDQFRKRGPEFVVRAGRPDTDTRTPTEERIADPTQPFVETLWDEEWQENLIDAAMDRVKHRVKPVHYQIFYLSVVKELGAAQVYVVKHRVAALVKKEMQQLQKSMDAALVRRHRRLHRAGRPELAAVGHLQPGQGPLRNEHGQGPARFSRAVHGVGPGDRLAGIGRIERGGPQSLRPQSARALPVRRGNARGPGVVAKRQIGETETGGGETAGVRPQGLRRRGVDRRAGYGRLLVPAVPDPRGEAAATLRRRPVGAGADSNRRESFRAR